MIPKTTECPSYDVRLYMGGEKLGFIVGAINYACFPVLVKQTVYKMLLDRLNQQSSRSPSQGVDLDFAEGAMLTDERIKADWKYAVSSRKVHGTRLNVCQRVSPEKYPQSGPMGRGVTVLDAYNDLLADEERWYGPANY